MTRDYIIIGSTPSGETCIGVGQPGARTETLIYSRQLKREFPAGEFRIKAFNHEFGTYHEVVAWFNTNTIVADDPERQAAFDAEGGAAENWDDDARVELFKALGESYFSAQHVRVPIAEEIAAYDSKREQQLRELEAQGK